VLASRVGVVALVALAGLTACGTTAPDPSAGALARIRARGELVWAADLQGGAPYVYEDPADPTRIIGFEADIMAAIARRLGVRQRMVQYNWSNLIESLIRGDFDMTLNGIEATADRQARVLLSRPYFIYGETLAVRKGSAVRGLGDLAGKRVGTLNQSYAHDLLRAEPLEVVLYEGVEEPYLDLVQGRIDGVLLDDVVADHYGCPIEGVACLPEEVARGTYVAAFRLGDPDLKAAVDGALDAMAADGELRQILERYALWNPRQLEPPPPVPGAADRIRAFDGNQVRLFVAAALVTLGLSLAAFALAVPLGLLLAVARLYGGRVARGAARAYVELFRGTPVLLQLFVLYYGLAPYYSLGPIQAAILGLGLNYAAYEAEVYRGALLALPRGQTEAAQSLGLGRLQILRHVLLPQAVRIALPASTNDFVALLKDTSLVSVITVIELTKRMTIAAVDLHGWLIPGLACAVLYLALSFPLAELARRLERRLARDRDPRPL
jgi:polar amino acid transport system substrate-binding protein